MEACGTGCNSVDWVLFQYNINGTGWVDPTNSYFCSGPCAGMNVVVDDDYSGTYNTGCFPVSGNTLQLRIAVQCWAGSEFWQIDNVQVSCSSPDAGTNGTTSICSSAAPINLFNELGGSPDSGGTWSGPSNLTGGDQGTFDPSTMSAGQYIYSVGTSPCVAIATVDVSFSTGALINAGTDVMLCSGSSTSLTATGGVSYNWDNGLGAGASHSVSPATTTTYTVTGTDVNGCTGTDQVIVTVNQSPTPSISGITSYCSGFSAALSTVNSYASYSWSTGDNTSTTNATTVNNPITVTVTDAAGCTGTSFGINVTETGAIINDSSVDICQGESVLIHGNSESVAGVYSQTFVLPSGCDSTSNVTLNVNALPTVNAGTDQILCADGTQVTLNASGATNVVWDNGVVDGVSFTPTPGTTTYTVSTTDANGCTGTDQVDVIANPLPVVSAGSDQDVCIGDAVTLSGSGANSYTWDNGISNSVSFTPALGTMTYTVEGTDANGCSNTDQVDVTAHDFPTVSAGSDLTICPGDQVNLAGSGAATYIWNNGVIDGVSFTPSATSTYTVTGTSAFGCSATDDVTVTVETLAMPSFSGDVLTGCPPLDVNFTNTTSGNFVSGTWLLGNGDIVSNLGSASTTYNQSGSYDVTLRLVSASGCVIEETYTDYIFVEDTPDASFIPSSATLSGDNPLVQFNNTTTGATNYMWDFGDGSQSDLENPSHYFDLSIQANYEVELVAISSLGCTDTAVVELTSSDELIYYIPNAFTPDGDEFNQTFQPVFTEGFDPYDYTLLIFNRWGEIVFESHDTTIGWDGTYPGSNTPIAGVFTWKVEFKMRETDERIIDLGHVTVLR